MPNLAYIKWICVAVIFTLLGWCVFSPRFEDDVKEVDHLEHSALLSSKQIITLAMMAKRTTNNIVRAHCIGLLARPANASNSLVIVVDKVLPTTYTPDELRAVVKTLIALYSQICFNHGETEAVLSESLIGSEKINSFADRKAVVIQSWHQLINELRFRGWVVSITPNFQLPMFPLTNRNPRLISVSRNTPRDISLPHHRFTSRCGLREEGKKSGDRSGGDALAPKSGWLQLSPA